MQGLQAAAKQHNLHVHVGIHVPVDVATTDTTTTTTTKLLNRTIWILPTGALDPSRSYDKLHLFDYGALRESAHTQAGTRLTPPFDTPVGRVGSLICFDLRFPEAALALASASNPSSQDDDDDDDDDARCRRQQQQQQLPAQVLTYPSAFTVPTGEAHWELLLRARAVETQCWVVAAAQVGWHQHHAGGAEPPRKGGRVSYGRSMVVDPWGRVRVVLPGVREGGSGSGSGGGSGGGAGELIMEEGAVGALGLVDIDLGEWERVREKMPLVRRL